MAEYANILRRVNRTAEDIGNILRRNRELEDANRRLRETAETERQRYEAEIRVLKKIEQTKE